jgi:hypothetical protein
MPAFSGLRSRVVDGQDVHSHTTFRDLQNKPGAARFAAPG